MILLLAPRAQADLEFCPSGSGAGQCDGARGIAVDNETGRLYVADRKNNRIDVFAGDGEFVFAFGWGVDTGAPELQTCTEASGCQAGLAGSGPGQLSAPTRVAVDNGSASPSPHAVYVAEGSNFRVQKFDQAGEFVWTIGKEVDKTDSGNLCKKEELHTCGAGAESSEEGGFQLDISVAVGPGGAVYVLDNLGTFGNPVFDHRLQRFNPDGTPIPSQCILAEDQGAAKGIVVDSSGNFWVVNQLTGRGVRKYDPGCALLVKAEDTDRDNGGIALDEAGNLFVVQLQARAKAGAPPILAIAAYEPAGQLLSRFGYDRASPLTEEIAVRNGPPADEGGIYVASAATGLQRLVFPPPPPTLPSPGPVAVPSSLEAKEIGSTKATLIGEMNPEGKATQVHFEYVDEATYLKDVEELGPGHGFDNAESTESKPLGSEDFELKSFEEQIGCPNPAVEAEEPGNNCLTPETSYRWRIVATNSDGGGEGTMEGSFKTTGSLELGEIYATGVGTDTAKLFAEANPHSIPATGFFEYVDDAAYQEDIEEGGDGFAAASKAPNVDAGEAPLDFGAGDDFLTRSIAVFPLTPGTTYHYRIVGQNPLLEVKGEAETIVTFEPPEVDPCPANAASRIGAGAFLPDCRAYEMVSPVDKAGGDIRVLETTLGAPAVLEQSTDSGEKLAYGSVRSFGDAQSSPFTSQYIARRIAGKEWETHSINPPRGRPVVGALPQLDTEFKAFSADLCQTWVTTFAEPPLAEGGVADMINLYRRSDRLCGAEGYRALAPRLVPESAFFEAGLRGISADGEHAIFTTSRKLSEEGSEGPQQLYESVGGGAPRFVCILPGGGAASPCTAGPNSSSGDPGPLSAISEDGERIFWSEGEAEGKIYARIGGTQTVAVSKAAEEAAGTSASWFWGAARNGSKAVFTTGNLSGAEAKLYTFQLAGAVTSGPIATGVIGVMGMSEDASRIYFASRKVLAPGAIAGQPNLYLYEAGPESTKLVATLANIDVSAAVSPERFSKRSSRVSPDGAHAAFVSEAPLTGYDNRAAGDGTATSEVYRYDAVANKLLCVSCNPSGARPAGRATIPFFETPIHAARVLSDDGSRLYFESADRLDARDTNGQVDVYQWEQAGTGGCEEADADFSAAAGGCVSLISPGQGSQDVRFVESTPGGGDVFFATVSSLLPQDPGFFDIYDARVGGGLPIPPPPPPPCEGDACAPQITAPEPAAPASSGYLSPPEEPATAPSRKRCAKGKRRVSREGKAHCVAKRKNRRDRRAGR